MSRQASAQTNQPILIEIPEQPKRQKRVIAPTNPVWTDNKAKFIMRYLRYFVYITKHGTYIDGFAGPQEERLTDSWAAKLVLESEPQRIRHFHLCDAKKTQIEFLEGLKKEQPERDSTGRKLNREITIYGGDFNESVDRILDAGTITEKEATFCLLDQRTFECDWSTVAKLANYKKSGMKIELFYFLANGWFERALSAQKDLERLAQWWGRDDWATLKSMTRDQRCQAVVDRLRTEFNYENVMAWPIYKKQSGGAVMYFMIHATDHPEAPTQMSRAYRNTVKPLETDDQLGLFEEAKGPDMQPPSLVSKTRIA